MNLRKAKENIDKLIAESTTMIQKLETDLDEQRTELADLRYKSECISQTIEFVDSIEVIPHIAGRGEDISDRQPRHTGMAGEIIRIVENNHTPIKLTDIHDRLHDISDYNDCSMNSISGTLTQLTQAKKLGRVRKDGCFHYYLNRSY